VISYWWMTINFYLSHHGGSDKQTPDLCHVHETTNKLHISNNYCFHYKETNDECINLQNWNLSRYIKRNYVIWFSKKEGKGKNLVVLIPGLWAPYTKDALKQFCSANHWYYAWFEIMLQYSVVSEAHNFLFKFWEEVEEEEWGCIYILLFSVLNENRIRSDKDTVEYIFCTG
jgi:hypothetical protein